MCKKQQEPPPVKNVETGVWTAAYTQYQQYCSRLEKTGRVLSQKDRYVILTSQILVYASKSNLQKAITQQLLEKAYACDFSFKNDVQSQEQHKHAEDFWKEQLATEQTSFAFHQK